MSFAGRIAGAGEYTISRLHLGELTVPAGQPMGGRRLVVDAFVVQHPDGVLLFDTGLGSEYPALDPAFYPMARFPVDEALAGAGVKRGAVQAIVNCHIHYDHSGGNSLFPGVPAYLGAEDWELRERIPFTIADRIEFPGADLRLVSQETEVMTGMRIVPTPGHTPGHQSLVIDDYDGAVVLAGQAAYTTAEFLNPQAAPARGYLTASDREAFLASIERIKALGPRRVYFAHDTEHFEP